MRRFCPQCHGIFETQFLCPSCGVETREVAEHSAAAPMPIELEYADAPGMATRFMAGLLLAQGIYYGISQFGIAFHLALGESNSWSTLGGLGNTALMLLAVFVGSLVAGAGNPRGMAAGAAMGLIHALALIGAGLEFGVWSTDGLVIVGWIPLTAAGALGGRCGRHIWPAIADIRRPAKDAARVSRASRSGVDRAVRKTVPIAWPRVLAGAAVAICFTVWAGQVRDYVIGTSGGKFSVDSRLQLHFVTWVIAALAVMVGGAVGGASTRGGIRHGLLVGAIAAIGIFLVQSQIIRGGLPAERFFASVIGLPEASTLSSARLGLFLLSNTVALAMFGGWFGEALLPRVQNRPARSLDRGSI
jgi:hypothetical protein